ncbi:MAG TPA: MBL fold metallo-hydrolase [bacterium]|nr:MBL fold metallo-hydrolase [bacterium]
MKIKFWGVRGSIPSPGGFTAKVGGNTSCVEVRAAGRLLIFDMGTGARALGGSLLAAQPVKAHVFFSHLHHDHTQGLPFFVPCFLPSSELTFYSVDKGGESPQSLLYRVFDYPYFPVPMKGMPSRKDFVALAEGQTTELGPDLKVFNRKLNHPDGVLGFRVEAVEDGVKKVFAFCTDTEHSDEADANVKFLAEGSDVFVCDAQYTDEEYPSKVGWGHSTVTEAAKLAIASGSKRLFLFHHDPTHNDDKVLAMEAEARALFQGSQAAAEGLEIEI